MADHKKFFIRVFGQAVPVTQDVYNAYEVRKGQIGNIFVTTVSKKGEARNR